MAKKLSLIVPFYNEGNTLRKTFSVLSNYLNKMKVPYELIFVNDGSTDGAEKILKGVIGGNPKASLISYKRNRGRGYALKLGFKRAKEDLVGYIDADLDIKEGYIGECVEKLRKNDVAIISKQLIGAKVKTSFLRSSASRLYNLWVRLVLGSKVSDHQGGLKIFRREILKKILSKAKSDGWLFDTELLYFAQKEGAKIVEVPITITYGFGKIRKSMVRDFAKSTVFILGLRLRR